MTDRTLRLSAGQPVSDLFRYAIGLEQMLRDLSFSNAGNYPPHNIERINEDTYVLTLAVAGFERDELAISVVKGTLVVKGAKRGPDSSVDYVYQGIAFRDFTREFKIGENVEVKSAVLRDGLLRVTLERIVRPDDGGIQIDIG